MKIAFRTVCAALGSVSVANASAGDYFWNQAPDTSLTPYLNRAFPDAPDLSTYQVHDVYVTSAACFQWIRIYTTNDTGTWESGVTSAVVNIFDRTGSLPGGGDDPSLGFSAPVTTQDLGNNVLVIQANVPEFLIAPGDYWIGITPVAPFGGLGEEFHYQAAPYGNGTAVRNPGGGLGLGTGWFGLDAFGAPVGADGAIAIGGSIHGCVPAPGALGVLGLAAFALRRRRRG